MVYQLSIKFRHLLISYSCFLYQGAMNWSVTHLRRKKCQLSNKDGVVLIDILQLNYYYLKRLSDM